MKAQCLVALWEMKGPGFLELYSDRDLTVFKRWAQSL